MMERTLFARLAGVAILTILLAGCQSGDAEEETASHAQGSPQVRFTNPGDVQLIQTPDVVVNIIGTASSDSTIEAVEWSNDRGGQGFANGKENWVTGNIVLQLGMNNITVTATDAEGESTSKSIAVEREELTVPAATSARIPEALYSYSSSLADAAPVTDASIDPGLTYFFFEPGANLEQRGISYIEYRCCRAVSGPGEGEDYGPTLPVSSKPWSLAIDLSGMAPGGQRRLRLLVHFNDGSETEAINFDFTVAGDDGPNRPPSISGNPPGEAGAGTAYSFVPVAADPDGDTLGFSIRNLPAWASFDRSTGRLSGTPTSSDVGVHSNIRISVSDGRSTVSLPAFAIVVAPIGSGSATLTWNAPTQREDNSTLTDLAGYEIHFGQSARSYSNRIRVDNPGITSYVVQNLPAGNWYFAVAAFDSSGQLSDFSNEGRLSIP